MKPDRAPPPISRRDFIAGATAAAAAAGTRSAAQADAPASTPAAAQRKLGFAFVGVGSLTMHQLLPGIGKSRYCKAVALVSGHPDKAKEQAKLHGIDEKNIYNYENFDTLRDNPQVDVVYVVLPNSMHAEYTIRAARAGKHVLCEKPMAVSVEECQKMIEACKSAGKKLQIGYRLHFEPNTIALIEAVASKQAGELKIVECGAGFSIGDPTQWRLKRALAGGGCLMDIGIYSLNAARYISGEEPVEVSAMTYQPANNPKFKEVEEHCDFQLRFPSGALASCTSSYGTGLNRFIAHCSQGWAGVEPALSYEGVKFQIDKGKGVEAPQLPRIDQFAAEMDAFSRCILDDTPSHASGEEGLRDLRIIEAIYQSAKSGQTVKL